MDLSDYADNECSCKDCKDACKYVPCWGTPDEIRFLIFSGYGKRLMMHVLSRNDFGARPKDGNYFDNTIRVISPAFVGNLGRLTVSPGSTGRCTFLTKGGLCELHDKNLKPLEGRIESHEMSAEEAIIIRREIFRMWDNQVGKSLSEDWSRKYFKS